MMHWELRWWCIRLDSKEEAKQEEHMVHPAFACSWSVCILWWQGQLWQIRCALEESIPVNTIPSRSVGLHVLVQNGLDWAVLRVLGVLVAQMSGLLCDSSVLHNEGNEHACH